MAEFVEPVNREDAAARIRDLDFRIGSTDRLLGDPVVAGAAKEAGRFAEWSNDLITKRTAFQEERNWLYLWLNRHLHQPRLLKKKRHKRRGRRCGRGWYGSVSQPG